MVADRAGREEMSMDEARWKEIEKLLTEFPDNWRWTKFPKENWAGRYPPLIYQAALDLQTALSEAKGEIHDTIAWLEGAIETYKDGLIPVSEARTAIEILRPGRRADEGEGAVNWGGAIWTALLFALIAFGTLFAGLKGEREQRQRSHDWERGQTTPNT